MVCLIAEDVFPSISVPGAIFVLASALSAMGKLLVVLRRYRTMANLQDTKKRQKKKERVTYASFDNPASATTFRGVYAKHIMR